MKFFRFLISRAFWLNAIIIILILFGLYFGTQAFLKSYTHHGESLTVPDFSGYTVPRVKEICEEKGLRYQIVDSIFVPDVPYFTVVEQNPEALSKVKQNRTIYIKISSDDPPKVRVPNLIDVSLRQAIAMLEASGFKVGELEYVPDIAQNVVLKIKKDGRIIKPGSYLKKGYEIDLVLGDGLSSKKVKVPDLRGLTLDESMFALSGFGLNIGAVIFDQEEEFNTASDSSDAIIYKQFPKPEGKEKIAQGEAIDLYLTEAAKFERMKIKTNPDLQDSIKKAKQDAENNEPDIE